MGMCDRDIQSDQREWLLAYREAVMNAMPELDEKLTEEMGDMPEEE